MADQTEGTIEIDADPAAIMEVIADYERYPEWSDVESTEVKERGADGRATEVAFKVSMMGVSAAYTLSYDYKPENAGVSWTTKEAEGAVKDIQGEYVLEPLDGSTKVTYRVSVELGIPVMGFLKRQGEKMVIKNALNGLKKRVEEG